MVVLGLGFLGWGLILGFWGWDLILGFWSWGFRFMGFWACGVGPSGFLGWGSLYKHKRIHPGKKMVQLGDTHFRVHIFFIRNKIV